MLNNDTKKIIDDARNTLVGQIPVPMMQCQQITLALTYKFMSDDDEQALALGGQRHYFVGDLAKYGWYEIMSRRLDDTQRSALYRAGLSALRDSEAMPAVFREIFKDAVVPYGDHRTLALFLNAVDRMEYDDSEKLGDAYEYLLKIAEAQADAGQFRTPRHIIDFIVSIVNPQKHEAIIDPACGTAGFLVSAYQHIKSQHALPGGGITLTNPELTRLANNLKGYDISPEFTKLAMANMYLHTQNKEPNIYNYDTLTSADRWNEYADVILANPPFMTPKGGIKPHTRFRIPARRAEVLFVDYIASHLNERGRAGVIVPEGIVFQSQNAYRQLRHILLDECLVAVVSLPAGVFNPYSGVKTSILILDKVLAQQTDQVAFFKVENDGYDLGAQRRPISKDDLPTAQAELTEYLRRVREGVVLADYRPTLGMLVSKERIAADGEYGLRGDRYQQDKPTVKQWPMVELNKVAMIESGSRQKGGAVGEGIPSIGGEQIAPDGSIRFDKMRFVSEAHFSGMKKGILQRGDTMLVKDGATTGKCGYFAYDMPAAVNEHVFIIRARDGILPYYLYSIIISEGFQDILRPYIKGIIGGISREIGNITIPLPPLEVQRELVAEIEGYQRVIDGCRAVVDNWQPRIAVDPGWEMVEIGKIAMVQAGDSAPQGNEYFEDRQFPFIRTADVGAVHRSAHFRGTRDKVNDKAVSEKRLRLFPQGTILFPKSGASTFLNHRVVMAEPAYVASHLAGIICDATQADSAFVYHQLCQVDARNLTADQSYPSLRTKAIADIPIALPPIPVQQAIVAEIEAESAAVEQARGLAERMAGRIAAAVRRVWGSRHGATVP